MHSAMMCRQVLLPEYLMFIAWHDITDSSYAPNIANPRYLTALTAELGCIGVTLSRLFIFNSETIAP